MRIEDMAREVVGEESVVKNQIGIVTDEISGLNEKIFSIIRLNLYLIK